jgi:hypothetical protein
MNPHRYLMLTLAPTVSFRALNLEVCTSAEGRGRVLEPVVASP